jgi:hypothetical protein
MYCYNILREVLLEKMLKHVDEASTLNLQVGRVVMDRPWSTQST